MFKKSVMASLVAMAVASIAASAAMAQATGPSSSASPYVTPTAPGVGVTSILTVGDSPAGSTYRMVGIPDGLGAYDNGDNTFTVLMNHELGGTSGIVRAHGATGAFVSKWVIDKNSLQVLSGSDLITSHQVWDTGTGGWVNAAGSANSFNRFCSADLPALGAFYNASTGLGTQQRIFMNGEEAGSEGRAYGTVVSTGVAYELPKLGKFSWENSVANPYSGAKTVVMGLDDSTPGQVYVYVGNKTNNANPIEAAGLNNGTLYGIKVNDPTAQGGATGNLEQGQINGGFTTVAVDTTVNGAAQQTASRASGITEFARPEDGHWADAKTFYFVTTGADPDGSGSVGTQTARLYKLSFAEAAGVIDYNNGSISLVKDAATLVGTDGATARSFDNMVVTEDGLILIQEDPGNSSYIAKTWLHDTKTGTWTQILESDRARFLSGGASFLTQDEENSGVIEITSILGRNDGKRYFLGDMQAHYGITGELAEGGQLYVVAVPEPETYALMLGGLGLVGVMARRRARRV